MDEETFIKSYKELTGGTDAAARAAYMYVCPGERVENEPAAGGGTLAFPQAEPLSPSSASIATRAGSNRPKRPPVTEMP